jgi:hypothetical protein
VIGIHSSADYSAKETNKKMAVHIHKMKWRVQLNACTGLMASRQAERLYQHVKLSVPPGQNCLQAEKLHRIKCERWALPSQRNEFAEHYFL